MIFCILILLYSKKWYPFFYTFAPLFSLYKIVGMLIFHSVTLDDQNRLGDKLNSLNCNLLNYSFVVQFLYRNVIHFSYATYKDFYISKIQINQKDYFLFPVGEGSYHEVFEEIKKYAFVHQDKLRFFQFCAHNSEKLLEWAETLKGEGCSYVFYPSEDEFEYIYLTESLAHLKGSALKPKRNHIHYFEKNYRWSYEKITLKHIPELRKFNALWNEEKQIGASSRLNLENQALEEAFQYYIQLDLNGILLKVEQELVAFSIGAPLNDDTYLVLFEKADRKVRGSYAMINKLFAQIVATGYSYINRAEDGGIEGLRKAKKSYMPDYMNEVYHLTIFK